MPDPDSIIVRETIAITHAPLSEESRLIAHEYSLLVRQALRKAQRYLNNGTYAEQLAITKALLSQASKLAGADAQGAVEQHRIAFEGLLTEMRNVPLTHTVVTDDEILDVDSTTLPARTINQGYGGPDTAP
jgi:hypothetical protein